jgi:soluble lytic murein transglycosylase-like protein
MLGAVVLSPATLDPIIEEMSRKYNVEPALVRGIIKQESNWDVNASRFEAHKGDASWGLMQLMLETARGVLGNSGLTTTQLVNPQVNIEAGTKLISDNLRRWGNLSDAIAAYNAGSPRIDQSTGKYVNADYVSKVLNNYNTYKKLGTTAGNILISVEEAAVSEEAIPVYALVGLGIVLLLLSKRGT